MTATLVAIASILAGFCCVMVAYYRFQRRGDRRGALLLGIAALLFLTIIPTFTAVFFAASAGR